ncbi:hypothetical protein A2U01_0088040, partial [Trifolium medium]|nr:hypothetical protein [Trifolium medium]
MILVLQQSRGLSLKMPRQPSVGEKSVVIPSPSCSAAHRESQPSPAQNL